MFPNISLKFCSYLDALKDVWLSLKATFFCRVSGTQLDQQSTHTAQYSDDRDTLAVFFIIISMLNFSLALSKIQIL